MYNHEDDLTIIKYVQETPSNLAYAFERAAIELGKPSGGVSQRYYRSIKDNNQVLALASPKGIVLNNSKIVARKRDQELSEVDIIELMQGMFQKLSTKGRKMALQEFLHL